MSKRYIQRQADPELRNRVLTLVFGAIPATLLCYPAVVAFIFGLPSLPNPLGVLMVLLGGAGILGTYSLWMTVFGFWSRFIAFGLVAGIVVLLPGLILPGLLGGVPAILIKASPVYVALVWLMRLRKATRRVPRTPKEQALRGIAVMVPLTIPTLAVFAPVWATPIAKLLYEPGFEKAVTRALEDIPDSENACIYDDGQNMFVTSIEQLDVGWMIEQSVRDKAPRPRLNSLQRDPHFRVYSDGRTYFWSFRDKKLHAFRGNRWTLAGTGKRLCENYRSRPQEIGFAFEKRNSIAVTESNFCCIPDNDP